MHQSPLTARNMSAGGSRTNHRGLQGFFLSPLFMPSVSGTMNSSLGHELLQMLLVNVNALLAFIASNCPSSKVRFWRHTVMSKGNAQHSLLEPCLQKPPSLYMGMKTVKFERQITNWGINLISQYYIIVPASSTTKHNVERNVWNCYTVTTALWSTSGIHSL